MGGSNRKDNKENNIETYADALQEIINLDIDTRVMNGEPTIKYIRERLVPKTRNGKYTIMVEGKEKELTGFDRVKTSFARRSWKEIDKVLEPLENETRLGLKKIEQLEKLINKIVIKAKTHKSSMMNDNEIYSRLPKVYEVIEKYDTKRAQKANEYLDLYYVIHKQADEKMKEILKDENLPN